MSDFELKSTMFRREREESWKELEQLLVRVEAHGIRTLSHEELSRLPTLYRGAISSLSVARAISLDRNVLDYLTNLSSRAYVVVYSSKRHPREAVADFVMRHLPRTVRRYWGYVATSIGIMVLGMLCGYLMTAVDVDRYYSFVPEEMAQGRTPAATNESLRESLYDTGDADRGRLEMFASFLFTHNAKVGILCFALGFAAGVPVVMLLFYNGLILGAMAGLYSSRQMGTEFWAWVLPHGVTELLAVCLCGAAGLVFGMAIVFPGKQTRLRNLALRGRQVGMAVIGAVVMLFFAALLEGFFRQLVHSVAIRWSVALATAVLWCWYFGWWGREAADDG